MRLSLILIALVGTASAVANAIPATQADIATPLIDAGTPPPSTPQWRVEGECVTTSNSGAGVSTTCTGNGGQGR